MTCQQREQRPLTYWQMSLTNWGATIAKGVAGQETKMRNESRQNGILNVTLR